MRLSLTVLLVTLALCCYEANAKVCPALMSEGKSLFLEPAALYNLNLQRFLPPRVAVDAKMKVKACIDQIPREYREKAFEIVKRVEFICNS
nr:secretoglobin family 1D member 2-like [Desmodus rotundus]